MKLKRKLCLFDPDEWTALTEHRERTRQPATLIVRKALRAFLGLKNLDQ